ncbi:hypothetical protein BCR44DRAFT_167185 [Catenaria anguillulae PL171]|uniref:Fork-head domain-containing protein n=1 Tax=Catenaria anguillulae PL171 TaxID=765915 RepID=A0A1Y2HAI4_9FUNG|nr:hypothetical protein BCR44DRAFT_167185 [Catenaria anguillulae PL171]
MSNLPFSPAPSLLPNETPISFDAGPTQSVPPSSSSSYGHGQQTWGYWDGGGSRPSGVHGHSQPMADPRQDQVNLYHSSGPDQHRYEQQQQQHTPYYQGQSQYPQSTTQPLYPPYPRQPLDLPPSSSYIPPGPSATWSGSFPPSSLPFSHSGAFPSNGYQNHLPYDPTVPRLAPPIDLSLQQSYNGQSSHGQNTWQQSAQPGANPTIPSQHPDPLTLVPQFRRRSISAPSALDSVLVGVPGARTSPSRGSAAGPQTERPVQQQPASLSSYPPQPHLSVQATAHAAASDASDSPPFSLLSPAAQYSPVAGAAGQAPLGLGPAEGIVLKTGMQERPPYPLSTLIAYAIATSPARRLTLQEIYAWLLAHYPYYSSATTNWRNTCRHTLSTSNAFVKQEKSLSDFGKGAYWLLDPNKADKVLKKARRSSDPYRSGSNAPSRERRYRATSSRPDLGAPSTANGSVASGLPADSSHRSFIASGNASAPTRTTPLRQMIRRPSGPISAKDPASEPAHHVVPLEPPAQPQYPNSSHASAADILNQSWSGGLSRNSTSTGTSLSTSTSLDSIGSLPAQPGDPVVAAEISQLFSATALSSSEPMLPSLVDQNHYTGQNLMPNTGGAVSVHPSLTGGSDSSQNQSTPWIPPSTASLDGGLLGLMQQVDQHQQHFDISGSDTTASSAYNTGAHPSQASTPLMALRNTPSTPPTHSSPSRDYK